MTQCHLKSRWRGAETADTRVKSAVARHSKCGRRRRREDTHTYLRSQLAVDIRPTRTLIQQGTGNGRDSKCAFGAIIKTILNIELRESDRLIQSWTIFGKLYLLLDLSLIPAELTKFEQLGPITQIIGPKCISRR